MGLKRETGADQTGPSRLEFILYPTNSGKQLKFLGREWSHGENYILKRSFSLLCGK